jgi:hypothetical protein
MDTKATYHNICQVTLEYLLFWGTQHEFAAYTMKDSEWDGRRNRFVCLETVKRRLNPLDRYQCGELLLRNAPCFTFERKRTSLACI